MKKTLSLILALTLITAALSGCGPSEDEGASSGTWQTEEAVSETEEILKTETEEEYQINPLTGEKVYSEDYSPLNRPAAVTVNNAYDSLPQYGTGEADIIFEIPVEGYLTRFLCIYSDCTDVPYIVSVRSYRSYFAAVACGFDAVYIHWGQDSTMMDYYYSLDMDSYNGIYEDVYEMFGRDQSRISSGYALEHSSYFDGTLLAEQMEEDGIRTEIDEEYEGCVFEFSDSFETVSFGEEQAQRVEINFGGTQAELLYDEESQTYLKYTEGTKQIDGASGEQLSFVNVIVLEASMWTKDDGLHIEIELTGEEDGKGYYISGGSASPITWAKEDEYSQFVFYDEEGNELEMNRGKTYIAITRAGTYSIE